MKSPNQTRLRRQHQPLSYELFSQIVREEIDKYFDEKYLTDQRVPRLIYKYKDCTIKELKEEIYDLFFKSFYEVCVNVKNKPLTWNALTVRGELVPVFVSIQQSIRSIAKNNLSVEKLNELTQKQKKLLGKENDLRIWWCSSYNEIDSYEINAKGEPAREAYRRLIGKSVQLDEKGCLDIRSEKIRINLRLMHVYFYGFTLLDIDTKNSKNGPTLTIVEEPHEQAEGKQIIKYKTAKIV